MMNSLLNSTTQHQTATVLPLLAPLISEISTTVLVTVEKKNERRSLSQSQKETAVDSLTLDVADDHS